MSAFSHPKQLCQKQVNIVYKTASGIVFSRLQYPSNTFYSHRQTSRSFYAWILLKCKKINHLQTNSCTISQVPIKKRTKITILNNFYEVSVVQLTLPCCGQLQRFPEIKEMTVLFRKMAKTRHKGTQFRICQTVQCSKGCNHVLSGETRTATHHQFDLLESRFMAPTIH